MVDTPQKKSELSTIGLLYMALKKGDIKLAHDIVERLHPSEIADIIESMPSRDRDSVWQLIDIELEGDVLSHLHDTVRIELLEQMHPNELANVTRNLDADDVVDILQDLPNDVADTVLDSMDEQNLKRLSSILIYPEDTAGGLLMSFLYVLMFHWMPSRGIYVY